MFNFVKREVYSIVFAPSNEEITFLNKLSIYHMASLAKDNLIFIDKKQNRKCCESLLEYCLWKLILLFQKAKFQRECNISVSSLVLVFFFFFLTSETIHSLNSFSDIPTLGNVNFLNKKTLRIKYFLHAPTFITLTQCAMKVFYHLVSWINQENLRWVITY